MMSRTTLASLPNIGSFRVETRVTRTRDGCQESKTCDTTVNLSIVCGFTNTPEDEPFIWKTSKIDTETLHVL